MDAGRYRISRVRDRVREHHETVHQSRRLRLILSSAVFFGSLLTFTSSAQSACRDPEVAHGFGSLAYAANVDAMTPCKGFCRNRTLPIHPHD
jgi:hypothetical protein